MDVIFKSLVEQHDERRWAWPLTQDNFNSRLIQHFRVLHGEGECAGILCPYCAFDEYEKEKK